MSLVLQILGGLFLCAVVILAYYLWRIYRFVRRVGKGLTAHAGFYGTPSRLSLSAPADDSWRDNTALQAAVAELSTLGFQPAGHYAIEALGGLHVAGLVLPEEQLMAAVYGDLPGRIWVDLYCEGLDGKEITVSNAFAGGELDPRPGTERYLDATWSIRELYGRMHAVRGKGPFRTVYPGEFPTMFEQAYAADMDWRNSRGGAPTWEEYVRVATNTDAALTPEQLTQAYYEVVYTQGVQRLHEECVATFRDETAMPVRDWERIRGTCFALHEHIPNSHLADFIARHFDGLGEEHLAQLRQAIDPSRSAAGNFYWFNETLPAHLQAIKLGTVRTPVAAEIFATAVCPDKG